MKRGDRPGIPLDAIFCADGAPFPVLFQPGGTGILDNPF
jgi:hypothetical protein